MVDTSRKDTHVSLYLLMMRGDFDDNLRWPFEGSITFHLVDQITEKADYAKRIVIDDHISREHKVRSRVTQGERQSSGRGYSKFISLSQLRPKYLKNNSLRFRVTTT